MGRTNSMFARNLLNTFTRLEFLKNLTDLLRFESFTFHNTLLKLSIIFLFSNSLFFREAYTKRPIYTTGTGKRYWKITALCFIEFGAQNGGVMQAEKQAD